MHLVTVHLPVVLVLLVGISLLSIRVHASNVPLVRSVLWARVAVLNVKLVAFQINLPALYALHALQEVMWRLPMQLRVSPVLLESMRLSLLLVRVSSANRAPLNQALEQQSVMLATWVNSPLHQLLKPAFPVKLVPISL